MRDYSLCPVYGFSPLFVGRLRAELFNFWKSIRVRGVANRNTWYPFLLFSSRFHPAGDRVVSYDGPFKCLYCRLGIVGWTNVAFREGRNL